MPLASRCDQRLGGGCFEGARRARVGVEEAGPTPARNRFLNGDEVRHCFPTTLTAARPPPSLFLFTTSLQHQIYLNPSTNSLITIKMASLHCKSNPVPSERFSSLDSGGQPGWELATRASIKASF